MRDLLLVGVVLYCSLRGIRNPVFGILAFIGLGFLNIQALAWSFGRNFPFAMVIAVGTLVGFLFWREPKRIPIRRESLLLLGLWGMFGLSTLNAFYLDEAVPRFIHISKILLITFVAMSVLNTEARLDLMVRIIAFALGYYALKGGIFSIVTGGKYMVLGPEDSFIGANNAIGLAIAMGLPLLVYLHKTESRTWLRKIILAMIVFSFPAVVFTYSRGAWLGLGMAAAFLLLKSKHRLRMVAAGAVLSVALLPLVLQVIPERLTHRYEDLVNYREEGSAQSRFWNWEFATRMAKARPIFGGGFNYYSEETYAMYFPEFLERWPGKVWSPHSVWFTIIGEHGFPGFMLWIALIVTCFMSIRKIRRYGRATGGGTGGKDRQQYVLFADMLQGALLVYIVVGTFYDAAYFDLFYYLVAMIIVLRDRMNRSTVPSLAGEGEREMVGKIEGRVPSVT